MSLGFNQTSPTFTAAYQNLLRQDLVSIGITIPLVDWGVHKKQLRKTQEALRIARLAEEEVKQLRREVATLLQELPLRLGALQLYQENVALARTLQVESQTRFLLGKGSIELLLRANQSLYETELRYLQTLKQCWQNHYMFNLMMLE